MVCFGFTFYFEFSYWPYWHLLTTLLAVTPFISRSLPQRAIHRQNNKSCATIANVSLFIPLVPFQHFLRFAEKVLLDTRINKK